MRRTLTLSKETLRVLDDEELALVAGGAGSDHKKGHGKTGKHSSCNANKPKKDNSNSSGA